MLSVLPGVAFPVGQRNALPQDAGNAPTEKHCPRVIFVTCPSRWTKDTPSRCAQVHSQRRLHKETRSKDHGNHEPGGGAVLALRVSLLSYRTASCFATLLCFCVAFLAAFMDLQWAWLQSPQSHAGQSHQSQVLEKRPLLARCLAQNGGLMNVY